MTEWTYTLRLGAPIETPVGHHEIIGAALTVGARVRVGSLFGWYEATVTEIEGKHGFAETPGLFFHLEQEENGRWFSGGSISKGAAAQLGRALSG